MKMFLSAALVISSICFTLTASASDLKQVMQDMKKTLKEISVQAKDPSLNASSEKLALQLAKSTADAKLYIPSSAPDKAGQDLYIHMIDGVIQSANDLALAFHENDNAKAIILLSTLSQQKKDGHERFEH